MLKGGIAPFSAGHYHSGEFSAAEWRSARREAPTLVRALSLTGILAWHFSYASEPFQERYFPALGKWLSENKVEINWDNYMPFYFVYPMLTGRRRGEIFEGKSVLVINGAEGEKKQAIIEGLKREGVRNVLWCSISLRRSYYDTVDVSRFRGKCDLALVGAGIGKLRIMQQLGSLGVPCIDAGFVFEVLADRRNRFKRVMCATDSEWREIGSNPSLMKI